MRRKAGVETNDQYGRKAQIIILNGPSSSGKSTIARALQDLSAELVIHLDLDTFRRMLPPGFFDVPDRDTFRARVAHVLYAANRTVAALAAGGDGVILDIVLPRWDILQDAVERFRPYQVLFVGLFCPPEELDRREEERGDRRAGLARGQADWVHRAGTYDLVLDTSRCSPGECARQILETMADPPSPSAFEQLEARFAAGEIRETFFRD
jgi:chloramphenicol 3-O phosphotransferase